MGELVLHFQKVRGVGEVGEVVVHDLWEGRVEAAEVIRCESF